MLCKGSRFAPVAGLTAALIGCGVGDDGSHQVDQAIGSGSGAPRTFQCSFNAGPPATVPYRSQLNATFVDKTVSVDGMWQGVIGGGLWHVNCENTDCQAAADFPEGATKPIAGTGAVIGGEAFEELSWDVCPPDAVVTPGKTWSRALPATQIDDHTVSWEGRRSYTVTDISSGGIMTVRIQHDTRLAYSFGEPMSESSRPWFTDGTIDAKVEVCGSTPVVDQLTVTYVGPGTSGTLAVSRRDAGGCSEPTPTPTPSATPAPTPSSTPVATPDPTPFPSPNPTPFPSPDPTPFPSPNPTPFPSPNPTPFPSPNPSPDPTPLPSPNPTPFPSPNPTPFPSPVPTPPPMPTATPFPSPTATPDPTPTPVETPEPGPGSDVSEPGPGSADLPTNLPAPTPSATPAPAPIVTPARRATLAVPRSTPTARSL